MARAEGSGDVRVGAGGTCPGRMCCLSAAGVPGVAGQSRRCTERGVNVGICLACLVESITSRRDSHLRWWQGTANLGHRRHRNRVSALALDRRRTAKLPVYARAL
jgi:hypothetical protein